MDSSWTIRARAHMRDKKISQEKLASSLGCTRGAISHYLAGRRIPNLNQLEAIASCLEVHPAWLLYGRRDDAVRDDAASYGKGVPVKGDTETGPTDTIRGYLGYPGFSSGCYALLVRGTEYAPRMFEGEAILLDPRQEVEAGDDVLINLNRGGISGLYSFINTREDRITVNKLLDNQQRHVFNMAEVEFMHCLIAVIRANAVDIKR